MAEPGYVRKLSYSFRKRRRKLIKYRARLDMCVTLGILSGGLALLSLFLGSQALRAASGNAALLLQSAGSSAGRSFIAAVFLLMGAGVLSLFAVGQYAYFKRKYDSLRHSTQERFGTQDVCDCFVSTCTCEDDFIEDMDKNHHVNLCY